MSIIKCFLFPTILRGFWPIRKELNCLNTSENTSCQMALYSCKKHIPQIMTKKWCDEFKGKIFFSHGNLILVALLYGSKKLELLNKISDISGRILLLR